MLIALLGQPAAAGAQSAIAGMVTDESGAVLPGVTVEARSPALIEQGRSAVSNEQGQYRIIELRPGVYTVTFTLPGFRTVVREGVDLPANFIAPINARMQIGTLEETVTVTGASPVVDVQSANRREVVDRTLIDTLPQGRNYATILATMPAVVSGQFDVGGSEQTQQFPSAAYGGAPDDMAFMIDGMITSTAGLSAQGLYIDQGTIQEYDVRTTGGDADQRTPGINMNLIPREGGNRFRGEGIALWSHPNLQSDNLTDDLRAAGVAGAPRLDSMYDWGLNMGGPIRRDRLWFFASTRVYAFNKTVTNMFHDGIIGPAGTPVVDSGTTKDFTLRLTAQVTRNNKVTAFYDRNYKTLDFRSAGATFSTGLLRPEAAPIQTTPNAWIGQVKWTSTLTSRLLLTAGWSRNNYGFKESFRPETRTPDQRPPYGDIQKLELSTNVRSGAPFQFTDRNRVNQQLVANVNYVTGSHNVKAGVTYWPRGSDEYIDSYAAIIQRYRSGLPNSVILYNHPIIAETQFAKEWGVFVQDSWTRSRVTVNPGLRWDWTRSWVPAQQAPGGRWVGPRSFPFKYSLPSAWQTLQPRVGVAYDLFGTSTTVVKGSVGWYVSQAGQPHYNDMVASTDTRNWNDLNGNDVAEENELGPSQNLSFGIRSDTEADPNLKHDRQILYTAALEHELFPRLAMSLAYTRRSYDDMQWRDNIATTFDDYTLITIPDPRLNGQTLPVYNLSRAKLGQVVNRDMTSNENTRIFHGIDFTLRGRLANGANFRFGTSTGRDTSAICEVSDPNQLRFCDERDYDVPFRTRFRLAGVYPLPWGVQAGAVYQNLAGEERTILYPVTRTELPQLTVSRVDVQLNEPGTTYLPRVNQLDVNFMRNFDVSGRQIRPRIDLFNVTNSSSILAMQDTFGPALDTPLTILMGRLIRLGVQVDF
jgi:hypothetical protein